MLAKLRTTRTIPLGKGQRAWLYVRLDFPYRGFRRSFLPWLSGDEFGRRVLVLPFGPVVLAIALWITPLEEHIVLCCTCHHDSERCAHFRWRRLRAYKKLKVEGWML